MSPGPKTASRKLAATLRRKKKADARERRRRQRHSRKEALQDLQDGRYTGERNVWTGEDGSEWLDGPDIGYEELEDLSSDW
jgi:hypothetical protein